MSHYLVGVVVNDISEVDDILAPYDENMEVEPYIYRTKAQIIADGKARKERYAKADDIDDFMKEYLDATTDEEFYKLETDGIDNEDLDKDGNELSTYNPKSKWDWYSIGGRWNDRNNIIKLGDFKLYDDSVSADKIALHVKAWDSFNGKCKLTEEEEKEVFGEFRMWNDKYYLDRYGTCDNYILSMLSNLPYAFVDANGWYEQGQMGWFGCDNATAESIDSYTKFAEKYFTAKENQNKYIVWVDCHI